MKSSYDKSKQQEDRSLSNDSIQKKSNQEVNVVDNSSEAIQMKQLQTSIDNSEEVKQMMSYDSAVQKNETAQLQSNNAPIKMVKPDNKAAAVALKDGTVSKVKRAGHRGRGKHKGRELKEQLIAAGEDAEELNALTFMEYDVNEYDGVQRDAERIVEASNGRIFYTSDHYAVGSFEELV